ncbi:MAG: hypothetical protein HQM06_13320 [Magnetococcales bacterium]|nr:hypothetical protein [Magnetococcales bacterium]
MKRISSTMAAAKIGISPKTLAVWRGRGKGPPYHSVDGTTAVFYLEDEVTNWKEENLGMSNDGQQTSSQN